MKSRRSLRKMRSTISARYGRGGWGAWGNAGLGLYFCRRALKAQGGAIRVATSKDWPTTFAIHLPVQIDDRRGFGALG